MELKPGQRWRRIHSPNTYVVEISEICNNAGRCGGEIVDNNGSSCFRLGFKSEWAGFPISGEISNGFWEYLEGQDKP